MVFFRYMSKKKKNSDSSKAVDQRVKPQEVIVQQPQSEITNMDEDAAESVVPNWQDENEVRRAFIASEVFKRKY